MGEVCTISKEAANQSLIHRKKNNIVALNYIALSSSLCIPSLYVWDHARFPGQLLRHKIRPSQTTAYSTPLPIVKQTPISLF